MKFKLFIILFLCTTCIFSQEDVPVVSIDIPAQNMLKFNRFLINPTFSAVGENQSYFNVYHRNQWAGFDNNFETYLGSYSGRINDRSGLGLSVYHQGFGIISNFGLMSNYAYGIRLSEKSKLTLGFNLSYYNSGIDKSDLNLSQPDDPIIANLQNGSLISFQPGINLSIGSFDIGVYAENAADYNFKTNESVTDFQDKTFSGHLMYTNRFKNASGLMEDGKLTALTRVRRVGDKNVNLSGSLILDMPKLGWVQAGYDDYYGIAGGIGFNITKRLSLGYTIEKGINDRTSNFGTTHEINLAYAFQPTLSENRVYQDSEEDQKLLLTENEKSQDTITDKDAEIARLQKLVVENNMIIEEMMFKQDSMEDARKNDINKRFAYIIKYINDNKEKANDTAVKEQAIAMMKAIDEEAYATAQAKYNNEYNNLSHTNKDLNAKLKNTSSVVTVKLANVPSGAYVIANVFENERYKQAFIDSLKSKNIEANYFTKGNLKYVYIKKYKTVEEALNAKSTQFNGLYSDEVWVMNILNESSVDSTEKNGTAQSNFKTEKKYYVIVNVFSEEKNAKKYVAKLKKEGFEAGVFINPKNNYSYVYLNELTDWETALQLYEKNINYKNDIWIMPIDSM